MKKEEFIAKYGEEAYENHKRRAREAYQTKPTTKADIIAKYGEEGYAERLRRNREYSRKSNIPRNKTEFIDKYGEEGYENHKRRTREYHRNSMHRLDAIIRFRKRNSPVVSPDEAMSLLMKEAEECGCPELLNMDYMTECFNNNCKYGLVYGNLEILKYFYRLMQIKAAKNGIFTDSDKEMIRYFRNLEAGDINTGILHLNNNWVLDVVNADMAYVEDMIRNAKGTDLLLTEEKYNELKGLTNDA